jgi:hypothetical protein
MPKPRKQAVITGKHFFSGYLHLRHYVQSLARSFTHR